MLIGQGVLQVQEVQHIINLLESKLHNMIIKKTTNSIRSIAEAKYKAMAITTMGLTWICFLLKDIDVKFTHAPCYFATT